jgi:tetratricopeptide (TPR) repeat protein
MERKITLSNLDDDQDLPEITLSRDGAVRCVFSSDKRIEVGTGTTTRSHVSKLLWYVEELGNKKFSVRKINSHHVPAGEDRVIGLEKLLSDYVPEVEYYEEYTLPAMNLLEDYLDEGEEHREEGRLYSAEGCFDKALGLDEQNVRALFNLGLIYMEQEDVVKTRNLLRSLLSIKSTFTGKDQHLFNEFGISLRKHGLFDEAVEYYSRALAFTRDDDHLHYNLARANYERGDWEGCVAALIRSRELNPDLEASRELGELVIRLSANPALCRRQGKPPVPDGLAEAVLGVVGEGYPAAQPKARPREEAQPPEAGRARSAGPERPEPDKPRPSRELKRGKGYAPSFKKKG